MNEYFFWMDTRFVSEVPQPAQRILAQHYLDQFGAKIVYYSGEEWISASLQVGLKEKLKRTTGVKGFVFFTIRQFNYGPEFDFELMKEILIMGFEVHFAREEFSLFNIDELKEKFTRLYLYTSSNKNTQQKSK